MSGWLPVAPCTPQGCAGHPGERRGPLPATVLLLAGSLLTLCGVVCVPAVLLLRSAHRARLIRWWAYRVVRAFGVRVRITGEPAVAGAGRRGEHPAGELVVANHVSWLDIPLVAAVLPGRMLGKREIRDWPVLGPLAALGGTLFIERDRLRALPEAVRTVAEALRTGSRVVVFPEGTTRCGRGPGGRFGPAVFQAAIDAGATVRPVHLGYRVVRRGPALVDGAPAGPCGHRSAGSAGGDPVHTGAVAFVGDDLLAASLWRVVTAAGLTAEIHLLPPIPAAAAPGRRALARAAQNAVARDSAKRPAASVHQ
ncbi:1-acyl-sn-glycerol-3-phosphate acyltransferase [Streptomyces finlayi]|uniref:1-acyl-sn-glycerol-3-phosphate acyltransferase n=1 Tax=Streptomyces finlayi TaxID=67296 RepID=A0A7G7BDY9_9ACTN|nr:lysophospholipid acyltransferase family protein [Streptomyces finlayi]QNE73554.1 1-acyl-sn-glycerol-3-phosphate acyltransferase [Streptomyces finlayi]